MWSMIWYLASMYTTSGSVFCSYISCPSKRWMNTPANPGEYHQARASLPENLRFVSVDIRAFSPSVLIPFLPTISLLLRQRPSPNILMHPPIHPQQRPVPRPHKSRHSPLQHRMAPIRRTRMRPPLRSPRPAHLAQHALDKRPRTRHQRRRAADLGHGRGDEVRLHELNGDVVGCEFGAQRRGPLLQERFAAAVGC